MNLPNLVRIAKKGFLGGLVYAALSAGSLGAIQPVYAQKTNSFQKPASAEKASYPDSIKDYTDYRRTYVELSCDGVINSEDIEKLEKTLKKTLGGISLKLFDSDGSLKKGVIGGDMENSLKIYQIINGDLELFQNYLERKKEWLAEDAVQGKFWNYGLGTMFYMAESKYRQGQWITGIINSSKDEVRNLIYFNTTGREIKVPELSEEFPAKTKVNHCVGLFGGIAFPIIVAGAGLMRKKFRNKILDDGDLNSFWGATFLNTVPGVLLLDSVHPLVYPTRLALPVLYEGAQWIFGKKDYTPSIPKPQQEQKPIKLETEVEKPETQIPNPWEVKLPTVEDRVMGEETNGG